MDNKGYKDSLGSGEYTIPYNAIEAAHKIKTTGLTPSDTDGLTTMIGDKRFPVILCQHTFFTSGADDTATAEVYVVYHKKLSEIFIDHDEYDPSEIGIVNGPRGDKVIEFIEQQMNKNLPVSLISIADALKIGRNQSLYGTYVHDIKPDEVIDVKICPIGNPNKAKSLLKKR